MTRRLALLFGLLALSAPAALAAPRARADAPPRVELLTIEPGDEVWSRFGHTAVRVRGEPQGGPDLVFSFGYAPFDAPAFAWAYLRGEADFQVGVRSWPAMLQMYREQNRTFVRQPLVLEAERESMLVGALSEYLLPENRAYRYAQLTDNCATRVRDVIDGATGGALRRAVQGQQAGRYRDHTLHAAGGDVLLSFALDVVGGPNQDHAIDGWQALYLPQKLREAVADTRVDGKVLAPDEHVVFTRQGAAVTSGLEGSGRYTWLGACLLLAAWLVLRPPTMAPRLTGALVLALGLWMGLWALVVDTFVLVSQVPDFTWNENVLVFWPTDFALCALGVHLFRKATVPRAYALYAFARVVFCVLVLLLTWLGWWPQNNLVLTAATATLFAAIAYSIYIHLRGRDPSPT